MLPRLEGTEQAWSSDTIGRDNESTDTLRLGGLRAIPELLLYSRPLFEARLLQPRTLSDL
jgi:hypothetical protein